jgi:hypothetical protein
MMIKRATVPRSGAPYPSRSKPRGTKGTATRRRSVARGEEVALNIEVVVDGGMDVEKPLRGSC